MMLENPENLLIGVIGVQTKGLSQRFHRLQRQLCASSHDAQAFHQHQVKLASIP
jgi:hypothetical protein